MENLKNMQSNDIATPETQTARSVPQSLLPDNADQADSATFKFL